MTIMRKNVTSALVLISLQIASCSFAFASNWKPKLLSPAVEAKWINNVKNHKTKDGATVIEVLSYAAKMRPDRFKVGKFDVGYNGATGKADAVTIGYWIGQKRLPDDAFVDLGYDMNPDGTIKPVAKDQPTLVALEGGRDSFLSEVDATYTMTCHPIEDDDPDC